MEPFINISIIIHAFLGGVGLLTGSINIFSKKGSPFHHKIGKTFSISMTGSSLIALYVAIMPGHINLLLFLLSLFTIYMILAGNQALTFKKRDKQKASAYDKTLSKAMLIGSFVMILIGIYRFLYAYDAPFLFIIFGGIGLALTLNDFHFHKTFKSNKKAWLLNHIGRIVGALIASVTAFLIAGLSFRSIIAWVSPTVLGTIYITYWNIKLKKGEKRRLTLENS